MAAPVPPSRSLWQKIRRLLHVRQELAGLYAERQDLMAQRDLLERERNELLGHLDHGNAYIDKLEADLAELRRVLPFPPGHFYSPICEPGDDLVQQAATVFDRRDTLPVPDFIDEDAMRRLFLRIARHVPQLDFPAQPLPPRRYYRDNASFGSGDALILGCLMLEYRPKRIVEIGSGRSSHVMMDVNDANFGGGIALDFIEPFPKVLLESLPPGDPYRSRLRQSRAQDVPVEFYASLEPGDILFIDSSHVMKTASDVEDQWRRIIPALRPGVLIQIHDMVDGFEYPPQWVLDENRSWNELYLVRHILAYSEQFRVLFFNDFFFRRNWELTGELMPQARENGGASLWLEKLA